MPIVRIELHQGRTVEQKEAAARAIVEALDKHLGAKPAATRVIFTDVDPAVWFKGESLVPPK